ncbi:hypothetical protein BDZ89DRAFT_1072952 [Hymenopellis radicata]|nr:hypothetical protein BDZ89DRAFT_1072952 [Hymenopellis radicata]
MLFTKSFVAISFARPQGDLVARDAKDDLKAAVLADHNAARADYAGRMHANFSIGIGGNYGENLYATTAQGGDQIKGQQQPVFSSATGHFTQVVWKSQCAAGTIFGRTPASTSYAAIPSRNYAGQFGDNVGRHV